LNRRGATPTRRTTKAVVRCQRPLVIRVILRDFVVSADFVIMETMLLLIVALLIGVIIIVLVVLVSVFHDYPDLSTSLVMKFQVYLGGYTAYESTPRMRVHHV